MVVEQEDMVEVEEEQVVVVEEEAVEEVVMEASCPATGVERECRWEARRTFGP